jgi:putative Mg2+ transporter-C (MgtC) family protein
MQALQNFNPGAMLDTFVSLATAFVFGALIGLERQVRLGGAEGATRVVAYVVSGVGFLGAGAIIKRHSEEQVQGLTTAAGIWMTAAIGVACGLGREAVALLATLLALVILVLLPHVASAPPPQADAEPDTKPREP